MTIRYRYVLIVATAFGLAGIPACYTITKHPRLASLGHERPDSRSCTTCHSSEEVWAFGHSPSTPTYQSYSRAWREYYDTPWWYGKRWDFHPHVDEVNNDNAKTTENEN